MATQNDHLDTLEEIRSIMERSSRFISLSGLSGIFIGMVALIGAFISYWYFDYHYFYPDYVDHIFDANGNIIPGFLQFLFLNGSMLIFIALIIGFLLTARKAKKEKLPMWDNTAKRLMINIAIPLVSGGVFVLILLYHKEVYLVAPATLIFYGLALLNASKYTLNDIRHLGISEIVLGLVSAFFIGYGLVFWAIGFGVLHVIYGAIMYLKYER